MEIGTFFPTPTILLKFMVKITYWFDDVVSNIILIIFTNNCAQVFSKNH